MVVIPPTRSTYGVCILLQMIHAPQVVVVIDNKVDINYQLMIEIANNPILFI